MLSFASPPSGFDTGTIPINVDYPRKVKLALFVNETVPTSIAKCKNTLEAVKRGDYQAFTYLRAKDPSSVLERDEHGHFLTHWAAFYGHVNMLRTLISMKVPFKEASFNIYGHHPIHWACIGNHIPIIKCLLENNVSLESRDSNGASPLIVAAQYRHISAAAYLTKCGAEPNAVDVNGNTALHWAASQGAADMCRVLVYAGLDPHVVNNFQQNILHMAVFSGDDTTVLDILFTDGVAENAVDRDGNTSLTLARKLKNEKLVRILSPEGMAQRAEQDLVTIQTFVFGADMARRPFSFTQMVFAFSFLVWAMPMYIFKTLPLTFEDMPYANIVFMLMTACYGLCYFTASSVDPGFLPRNTRAYDQAMRSLCFLADNERAVDNDEEEVVRLCHTCRCVRPPRTSHCRFCKRCVRFLDHHCSYVNNCVGLFNRHTFLLASSFATVLLALAFVLGFYMWHLENWVFRWDYVVGLVIMCIFVYQNLTMTFTVWANALDYVATKEKLNWKRYSYLKRNGMYFNPFAENSYWSNVLMYMNLKPNPKEMEFITKAVAAEVKYF